MSTHFCTFFGTPGMSVMSGTVGVLGMPGRVDEVLPLRVVVPVEPVVRLAVVSGESEPLCFVVGVAFSLVGAAVVACTSLLAVVVLPLEHPARLRVVSAATA